MTNSERIEVAYDAVAADYDRQIEPAGWIRRALWRHFDRLFKPGDRILDVGCGTGSDAIHLARNGVRVTAIDASNEMLARLRSKLARESRPLDVDLHHGNIDDRARELTGPYDGIISAFAALNTVDLAAFAPQAARLLRPGGRLICHMLSSAYGLPVSRRLLGFRRATDTRAVDLGGTSVPHLNIEPDHLYRRFFGEHFERRGGYALGLLVSGSLEARLPASVLDVIGRIEPIVGAVPAVISRGRFFVLDLERRSLA